MSESSDSFSLARLLKVLVPIALVALAIRFQLPGYEKAAQAEFETNMLERLLGDTPQAPEAKIDFKDADGDLVADAPDEGVAPERLVFSYVASAEEGDEADTWAELTTALAEATGLEVEYAHYSTTLEQLAAMASGELHVAGLNTGSVPMGVEYAGFVPVCTQGHDDGTFGYTMQIIAQPKSDVAAAAKLAGRRVVFTRPDSNSGFKAALIQLLSEERLQPERDYEWGFSFAHEESIRQTIAGEYDAAPVASDILERMTADGEIEADAYKVIYESERFPPATIGHAHNLTAELRQKIADTLLAFDWSGTGVEAKYASSGVSKFVPVSYKDDWANVRRINQAVRKAKAGK